MKRGYNYRCNDVVMKFGVPLVRYNHVVDAGNGFLGGRERILPPTNVIDLGVKSRQRGGHFCGKPTVFKDLAQPPEGNSHERWWGERVSGGGRRLLKWGGRGPGIFPKRRKD